MKEPSFWERLGRGVGYGWQKAREIGSQVSDQLEGKFELEKAEADLHAQHSELGSLVADRLLAAPPKAADPEDSETRRLLTAIRAQRELVTRLRAEREATEAKARTERDAAEAKALAERETSAAGGAEAAKEPAAPPEDAPAGR